LAAIAPIRSRNRWLSAAFYATRSWSRSTQPI
jgi:hypothetical protein